MEDRNRQGKTVLTTVIVIVVAFLANKILGNEANWGATYEDLGRTVTAFIVVGLAGSIIWLLWRKKNSDNM